MGVRSRGTDASEFSPAPGGGRARLTYDKQQRGHRGAEQADEEIYPLVELVHHAPPPRGSGLSGEAVSL